MNSSTSHSKYLFGILITALVISYALGTAYTLFANPEIQFWKEAYRVKRNHANTLASEGTSKIVFAGGSSCAFQIKPNQLSDDFNIPSVNMGMHAGMGARVVTALALEAIAPGDTLILNLEPDLLSKNQLITQLGLQFLAAIGKPHMLARLSSDHSSWPLIDTILSLRPGLRNVVTMTAKLILRRPLYRYQLSDIHEGGYLATVKTGAVAVQNFDIGNPSTEGEELFSELRNFGQLRKFRIEYLLPWLCVVPENAETARQSLGTFIEQVEIFFPSIPDGQYGVDTRAQEFADTPLHLTMKGATRRTKILGQALEQQPTGR